VVGERYGIIETTGSENIAYASANFTIRKGVYKLQKDECFQGHWVSKKKIRQIMQRERSHEKRIWTLGSHKLTPMRSQQAI
jgi:hypothetical protein